MIIDISPLWSGAKTRDGREIVRAWSSEDPSSEGLIVEIEGRFFVLPHWDKYRSVDDSLPNFDNLIEAQSFFILSD